MFLLINLQHVSAQIGHQAILEEYTNGNGLHINYSASHHSSIAQESPDVPSGPKHSVNLLIKTFVCVRVTPPLLFVNTTNRMQHYKIISNDTFG
jgi:hypothetical protein